MPPVRVNSTTDIKGIQALLNNILGLDLSVDGRAGAKTREAVKIFQRKAGLSADGIVGPKTMAKLNASVQ
jgi:peptidoglycan hydrolase-like protein with peptidoglycan-binding domain